MKNPIYNEYKRGTSLGWMLIIVLASIGALIHYLRSVDNQVVYSKNQLDSASRQFDSQMIPLLAFAESMRRAALLKLSLPVAETSDSLTLLSLQTADTSVHSVSAEQPEWQMLLRLQPYYELQADAQPLIEASYYLSKQGFAYNGAAKWSDSMVDDLLQWQKGSVQTLKFETEQMFIPRFSSRYAALMLPLSYESKALGCFVYLLQIDSILTPLYNNYPQLDFMLLDQSGSVIGSSKAQPPQSIDEHLLHIQRLATVPWSLAIIEPKTTVFAAGLATFVWHWVSYFVLLAALLLAMRYRYKARTLSPISRLLIHIERLAVGQSRGVRHIPEGWSDIFDQVHQLNDKPEDKSE
ncbi:hypothetical protein [Rheinheimera maricola]|uniref:Uncharacterized protein n=1 Tax=Rheinheimera maricola TaxID=2793282 RepID=A0ABS7X9N0_9GAMM|nr:hypothetical protein [Rheinheimera maricola]MBZ9612263.1 hypothetical protein [Rheinheimera maricola]